MRGLRKSDNVVVRRRRRPRSRRKPPGLIVGVVENTALAREVVTVAGEAWPEDDFRVFNAVSLERELAAEEREPLLEAMHNPTFGQKERFAALRAEAQARLDAKHAAANRLPAAG